MYVVEGGGGVDRDVLCDFCRVWLSCSEQVVWRDRHVPRSLRDLGVDCDGDGVHRRPCLGGSFQSGCHSRLRHFPPLFLERGGHCLGSFFYSVMSNYNTCMKMTSITICILFLEVPLYIIAQLMGSILASCTLASMLDVTKEAYFGTLPVGSNGQSLAMEIVISFLLMFVISGSSTDNRAVQIPHCHYSSFPIFKQKASKNNNTCLFNSLFNYIYFVL